MQPMPQSNAMPAAIDVGLPHSLRDPIIETMVFGVVNTRDARPILETTMWQFP